MKEFLKKYLYEAMILVLMIIIITSVYFVKGRVGAFAWVASLFVIGPLGLLLSLLQAAVLVYNCITKKKRRVIHLVASLLMAFPTLILMGAVFIPYPDSANASEAVTLSVPIEGNTVLLGGKDYRTHAVWPSERYAYDIMVPPMIPEILIYNPMEFMGKMFMHRSKEKSLRFMMERMILPLILRNLPLCVETIFT
jgi:hypothetical protein